jgi:hypothetical protein
MGKSHLQCLNDKNHNISGNIFLVDNAMKINPGIFVVVVHLFISLFMEQIVSNCQETKITWWKPWRSQGQSVISGYS